ncbi:MAG: hypothetical protein FD157_2913 [Rhodocyclaceae bacterium]|nr:MAG: hypothetical protein FD157_2913 [Rhodocyclaceae bacterium]TND03836.1 MAG: hypothetical protein FD118_1254 [Rhodocyclaceae bacterium]
MARLATVLASIPILLGGCVYMPETTVVYDPECGVYERKMTLEAYQVGSLMGCRDESCVTTLVVMGVASAASAIISGSVMVVENVASWLEKKGRCLNPGQIPSTR